MVLMHSQMIQIDIYRENEDNNDEGDGNNDTNGTGDVLAIPTIIWQ